LRVERRTVLPPNKEHLSAHPGGHLWRRDGLKASLKFNVLDSSVNILPGRWISAFTVPVLLVVSQCYEGANALVPEVQALMPSFQVRERGVIFGLSEGNWDGR